MDRFSLPKFVRAFPLSMAVVFALAIGAAPARATCPTLAVPGNVAAEQGAQCSWINVTWNSVANATGYDIKRKNPDGTTTPLATDWNTTSWLDAPPTQNGAIYKYDVAAHYHNTDTGEDCAGNYSADASGFTKAIPATPASLTITDVNSTTIHLEWPVTTNATGYGVYRYELTTGPKTLIANIQSGSTTSTDYSETECGTHRYSVTAYDLCGESAEKFMNHAAPGTPTGGAPGPPPLTAPINNALVCAPSQTLTWGTGCLATGYRVQLSTASDFSTLVLDVTVTNVVNRSVNATNLAQSTTYYWRVESTAGAQVSTWSSSSFHTGRTPYMYSVSAPWVTRNFLGYVYWGETGTATMHPDAGGCGCNTSWTLSGGGPYNYATNWSGLSGSAHNISVSQTLTLTYNLTTSNAFGAGNPVNIGFALWPGSRPAGGCPYVAPWNGTAFVDENNLLPQSEWAGNQGRTVSDYYTIQNEMVADHGFYKLALHEFENESSRFDDVRLLYVDHPEGTEVFVDPQGQVTAYAPSQSAVMERGSTALAPLFKDQDAVSTRTLEAGDQIDLAVSAPASDPAGRLKALLLHGAVPNKPSQTGVVRAGGDRIPGSFTFRERTAPSLVLLGNKEPSGIQLDIQHHVQLQGVEVVNVLDQSFKLNEAPLAGVQSSSAAKQAVSGESARNMSLEPGGQIELRFAAAPIEAGMERTFVIYTRGSYVHGSAASLASTTPTREYFVTHARKLSDPDVTFEFSLARSEDLMLSVHDVQGREVARVAQGQTAAGVHNLAWSSRGISDGVYFAQLRATGADGTSRLVGKAKLILLH
jgi:hypothetical protein